MMVYKIYSGDRWYKDGSFFTDDPAASPNYTNRSKAEATIRGKQIEYGRMVADHPDAEWFTERYDFWKLAEVASYELVRID
jgi:hypothetical protein